MINLSLSGLLAMHDYAIAVDSELEIRISLGHVSKCLSDFKADARVRWYRKNERSGLFGYGFEFLDNTNEQRSATQEIIDVSLAVGD